MVWRPIVVPRFDLAVGAECAPVELPRGHIPALDAIRGLAIFAVTLYRFGGGGDGPASAVGHNWFVDLGSRGVDLFFVLSGFLITGILFDAKGKEQYFRNFYVRRSLRIFPLYYAALAATLFVLPGLSPTIAEEVQPAIDSQAWLWLYGANVWQSLRGEWSLGPLNHFWSLAIEEHFYLLWPAVICFTSRRTAMRVCGALFFGSIAGRALWLAGGGNNVAAEVLTPLRMDGLALGSWLALAARGAGGFQWLVRWARPGFVVFGLVALAADMTGRRLLGLPIAMWACAGGTFLVLVVAAAKESRLGRVGESQTLQFFGKYSYAMYVFQLPLVYVLAPVLTAGGVAAFFGSAWFGQAVYCGIMFGLTTAAALVSWNVFEKHWLGLKQRFGG